MNVKEVISLFENDPMLNLFLAKINEPKINIKLKGLVGSSDALTLLITSEKIDNPLLVIMHDKEDAGLLINDLANLKKSKIASFFLLLTRNPISQNP